MATNLEDKVRELEANVAELYDREALRDLRLSLSRMYQRGANGGDSRPLHGGRRT